jgi:hypothetical protein
MRVAKHSRGSLSAFRALAALARLRHDRGNTKNQAAIRVRRDKGGFS